MNKKGNFFVKLLFLFTIVPLLELFLLFQIAKLTNWGLTFVLVITTGLVGAYLAKKEGTIIFHKIRFELRDGRLPGKELINGLCVLIGGAFLLTPGILTDMLGFTLLIPVTRNLYKKFIKKIFKDIISKQTVNIHYH